MFRNLSGESREPTWAEREHLDRLRAEGIQDVYVVPEEAPQAFWNSVAISTTQFLLSWDADLWDAWGAEVLYAFGWSTFRLNPGWAYKTIVEQGVVELANERFRASTATRLSAIEHALDVVGEEKEFEEAVNDRARWFRVGLRLEGSRFVPVTSEHLHKEVVQPTLLLLSDQTLSTVDGLYRKGFERMLSGDPAGAVTGATSSIEEMLRIGLGQVGGTLDSLAKTAQGKGWLTPSVYQLITKLSALRRESDAHSTGTDEKAMAELALNVAGSVLLYLAATRPEE